MARVRDRTEDFKDAIRQSSRSLGYDEAKLASIMATFIIHKPRQRSSFTKAALKTANSTLQKLFFPCFVHGSSHCMLESIGELDQFLLEHRKDYTDLHRTTEQVSTFIKTCQEQIDVLKNSINDEEANSKGWLGIPDRSNADTIAHKHGVALILSERLRLVTAQFDQLRAIHFQDAINRAIPRRKLHRMTKTDSAETSQSDNMELREPNESHNEPLRVQQQFLDDETHALQVELSSLLDAVQETETNMVEMSTLNHLMSTHVLHQAQQIEFLYEQAVEATKNVELGNKELSLAIQRNSSSRTFLLLFLFVLTFSILFLDWYS